jgi:SprT protein
MPSKANPVMTGAGEALARHLPGNTVDIICSWIDYYDFSLKISRSRHSKLGDYRSPYGDKGHRITINHDLNRYAFLITLVHEVAHLVTWNRHRHRVPPHGKEWKASYMELMEPFLTDETFPPDVLTALRNYMQDPAAASCTDAHLFRTLRRYDEAPEGQKALLVESLPENSVFRLSNGMILRKGALLRKRFKCVEVKSRKVYLVSPLAEAMPLQKEEKKGQLALF